MADDNPRAAATADVVQGASAVASLPRPGDFHPAWWLGGYALVLAGAVALLATALSHAGIGWQAWRQPVEAFAQLAPALKLTVMAVYLSLATVFLPLPTPWLIAGLASPQSAVAAGLWPTVLLVAAVGAAGSTIANLNEYHMLSWIMRFGRAGRLRDTRAYRWACRWFDRSPFFLLAVFNLLPLPVDAVRMLAAVRAYPRGAYAAANFVGRFGRYGVIAFVTYYWKLGWAAVVALLGLSVALGLIKTGTWAWKRARAAEPAGR